MPTNDGTPLEMMTVGFWRKRMAGLPDTAKVCLLMVSTPSDNLDVQIDSLGIGEAAPSAFEIPPDALVIYVSIIDTENEEPDADEDDDQP